MRRVNCSVAVLRDLSPNTGWFPKGSQLFSFTTLQTPAWRLYTNSQFSVSPNTDRIPCNSVPVNPVNHLGLAQAQQVKCSVGVLPDCPPLQATLCARGHPDLIKGSHGSHLGFNSWFKWFVKLRETLYLCLLTGYKGYKGQERWA